MSADTAEPAMAWRPEPVRFHACVLCGASGPEVRMGLIRWPEGDPWGCAPRCRDHDACHERVLANGDEWPVADGRDVRAPGARPAMTRPMTEEAPGMIQRHSSRNDPPPDQRTDDDDDDLDFGEAPA